MSTCTGRAGSQGPLEQSPEDTHSYTLTNTHTAGKFRVMTANSTHTHTQGRHCGSQVSLSV